MSDSRWQTLEQHPELSWARYKVPNFASNCMVLKHGHGQWTVLSPGEELLDNWPGVDDTVTTLNIVMPNGFHYMGVSAWQARYPNARFFASRQAIARLTSKGLRNILPLEDHSMVLPEGYQWLIPPGHRAGDVWLCKRSEHGNLWITCDSFLNYARYSHQPVARLLQKTLNAAPGLKISQVVKWFILTQRSAFKTWALQRLADFPPQLLLPSHGELDQAANLAERLQQLLERRL